MSQLYDQDSPELGSISITISNIVGAFNGVPALELKNFLSYEYEEDFLTPVDAWRFTVSGDSLTAQDRDSLVPGATVEMSIGGHPQSVGYIDDVKTMSSSQGGTIITVKGRDWLSPAVDAQVDPQLRISESMSILDVLAATFAPFRMKIVALDNNVNRNAITGKKRGPVTRMVILEQTGTSPNPDFSGPVTVLPPGASGPSQSTYVTRSVAVQTWLSDGLQPRSATPIKPYPQEGAFSFASRVAQRVGLWIWPSSTLGTIVVGRPDYAQEARYQLLHSTDEKLSRHNNILDSDVCLSRKHQPTIIFASGFGGGGNFAKSRLRGGIINPIIYNPALSGGSPLYAPVIAAYPDVAFATFPYDFPVMENFIPIPDPCNRPLYLYDAESHTQAQLESYLRREMSLRLQSALTANFTIMGHMLNSQPICVDTIINVKDDRSRLDINLWVLGRKFTKSAVDGTTTQIECLLPGALSF